MERLKNEELFRGGVGGGTLVAGLLLYLVDQHKKAVKPEIRIAVEAAFRWSVRDYPNMDEADLAAMTEAVALGMSKPLEEIQSPRRYVR